MVRVSGEDDRRCHRAHPVDGQDTGGHAVDTLGQGPLVGLEFRAEGADGRRNPPCLRPCDNGGSTVAVPGPQP